MSGEQEDPKNPVGESRKGKSDDEKENDKKVGPSNKEKKGGNVSDGEESEAETSDDKMSYEKQKAWKKNKKEQRKKKKSSSQVITESSDDSDTDSKRRASCSSNKGSSSRSKGKGDNRRVSHDYTFSIPSEHNASINMGKPSHFDGTGYNQWKTKMFGYLNAIHKDLWKVVEVGCDIPDEDETPTPV